MANTFRSTLLALNPTHYWALDEASGLLIDSGSGSADLSPSGVGGDPSTYWFQGPGYVVRGTPRSYGITSNNRNPNPFAATNANLDPLAGNLTGVFGCCLIALTELSGADFRPYTHVFNTNVGLTVGFRIESNGRLSFQLDGNTGRLKSVRTAIGFLQPNTPYFVCAIQRADGNDVQFFINGANTGLAVANAGAGVGVDSWVQDVMVGLTPTAISVAGGWTGIADNASQASESFLVSEPFTFVNSVISDSDVLALWQSMNVGSPPSDYYEHVFDLAGSTNRLIFHSPNFQSANGVMEHGVQQNSALETVAIAGSAFEPAGFNQLDNVPNRRIVTDYSALKYQYEEFTGQNPVFATSTSQSNWTGTEPAGSIHVIWTARAVPDGVRKVISTFGTSATNSFELFLIGSVLGYQFGFRAFQNPAETYRVLSGILHLGSDDQFYMLSVVQPGDGSGPKLYVNGQDATGFVGVATNPNVWIGTFGIGSASHRWGGEQGSSSIDNPRPGDLHKQIHLNYAQSPAEVALLWDAVNGIFPPEIPFGSFATKLQETGNNGMGPDWWWRMNDSGAPIIDIGAAQNRPGPTPPPINADSIATGGGPLFLVSGPLPDDASNAAVYFDGLGDYFEIGLNGAPGQLCEAATGTFGAYFSRNALEDENIIFAIGNDAYTEFLQIGLNGKRVELIVQTSAGNRATLTSSIDLNGDFAYIVLTSDGSNYKLYINGPEDVGAVVTLMGTGAEGDWFDLITADQTAIGARADVAFTTETTGRASEVFLYDGDVLSATEIAALVEAAIADGVLGAPAPTAVVTFENVTFKNGAFADLRVSNAGTSGVQQFIRGNKCRFVGGAQGDALYGPRTAALSGTVQAQFRGCLSDLLAAPNGFGRGGIVGTQENPLATNVNDGSILVSDCDFDRLGYINGPVFLSPVMCLAGFGMTVEGSRFRDCLGTGVGWLADAQRVSVINNQIDRTAQALGAIYAGAGLNSRLGSGWIVRGNKAIDTEGNAIDITGVTADGGTAFARNILIAENETDNNFGNVSIRVNQIGDAMIRRNQMNRCTEGVRVGEATGPMMVQDNEILKNTGTAIICAEGSLQLMDLVVEGNVLDGTGGTPLGDGITVANVRRAAILENKLASLDLGIQIGTIGIEADVGGNKVLPSVGTPFALLAGTITALTIGGQMLEDLGNANVITQIGADIEVQAHHHAITAGSALDLDTINGPAVNGFLLVLRRAPFSNTITVKDGIDNLNLAGDFAMATDNSQIWLVRDGANWNELSRFTA